MSFFILKKTCRVTVSFYFFALLCVAALCDRSGLLLWGLLAALLHEGGHIATMLMTPGGVPKEIRLTPFGIRIKNSPLSEYERGLLGILAAGSGANFLSAAVTFGFLPDFAAVSLVLGVMNLLPVEGMDGGGILRALLCRRMSGKAALLTAKTVSWATLGGMLLLGVYVLIDTGYNFTLLGATAALMTGTLRNRSRK